MKFLLKESIEEERYQGWAQEDIELFEAIDWDNQGDEDYDAGFAYLDSAVSYGNDVDRVETEFHKFFKNDPYTKPYYKAVEKNPFNNNKDYKEPIPKGDKHKDYEVYNLYDKM